MKRKLSKHQSKFNFKLFIGIILLSVLLTSLYLVLHSGTGPLTFLANPTPINLVTDVNRSTDQKTGIKTTVVTNTQTDMSDARNDIGPAIKNEVIRTVVTKEDKIISTKNTITTTNLDKNGKQIGNALIVNTTLNFKPGTVAPKEDKDINGKLVPGSITTAESANVSTTVIKAATVDNSGKVISTSEQTFFPGQIPVLPATSSTTAISGASCAGGSAGVGIGNGQWAQTGRGYKKGTTEICNSNADCAGSDLRECVQCVDGVYNNSGRQTCGKGSASHYITRPDQVVENKGLNNCWKGGAYYSDSSSLDGKSCSNGSWVDQPATETDNVLDAAKAVADRIQDKINECAAGKQVVVGDKCGTQAELDLYNKKQAELANQSSTIAKSTESSRLLTIYASKVKCDSAKKTGETCSYSGLGFSIKPGSFTGTINTSQSVDGGRKFVTYTFGSGGNPTTIQTAPGTSSQQNSMDNNANRNSEGVTQPVTGNTKNTNMGAQPGTKSVENPIVTWFNNLFKSSNTTPTATPTATTDSDYQTTYNKSLKDCKDRMNAQNLSSNGCDQVAKGVADATKIEVKSPAAPANNPVKESTVKSPLVSAEENKTLVAQYNQLINAGGTVTEHPSCDGLTECVVKVQGGILSGFNKSIFIEAADLRKAVQDNAGKIKAQATAADEYARIIAIEPRAFDNNTFGDGIARFGDYTTKGNCDAKGWTCIKVPGRLIYTYINIDTINAKSATTFGPPAP